MLHKKHRVHFVGIGGIGMSGIAEVLLNLGYGCSGSDLHASEATDDCAASARPFSSAIRKKNFAVNPSVVVISTAVKYSTPKYWRRARRHIPVIPRAEMLAELMRSNTASPSRALTARRRQRR